MKLENLMIQASAGSGKTHDLVGRYLRLIDTFEKPQSIVALTFTRKAASEFFDRILSALAEAAESEEAAKQAAEEYQVETLTQPRALELLRLLADHLHELALGTLDGFYARVLRAFPAEFGVTADYEVLEDTAATAARREVLDEVLGASDDAAATAFLEAFRRATFGSEERGVLNALEGFVEKFHARYLGAAEAEAWGNVGKIWPDGAWWLVEIDRANVDAALGVVDAAAESQLTLEKPNKRLSNALKSLVKAVDAVDVGFAPSKPPKIFTNLLAVMEGLHRGTVDEFTYWGSLSMAVDGALRDALVTAGRWILWCEISPKLQQTAGVWEIVRRYEQQFDRRVRRAGRLGFDDVLAVLAGVAPVRDALAADDSNEGREVGHFLLSMDRGTEAGGDFSGEDREALRLLVDYRLDAKFQHWLIDEFQDTSWRQWQVLRNLIDEVMYDDSGERSFYYVGDVKQAIFGWRGGDSRLFREVQRRYENLPDDRQVKDGFLNESWRSGPVILDMVNQVFGNVDLLAEIVGDEHRAVIDERWAKTWREHESKRPERVGYARWTTVPKGEGDQKERRWSAVLDTLNELNLAKTKLSCAVLVRRGASAHELADYVRQHSSIPVAVEGKMAVGTDHPVAASFAALLRWSAHPGDTRCRAHFRMTPVHSCFSEGEVGRWEAMVPKLVLRMVHDVGFGAVFEWWCMLLRQALEQGKKGGLGEFSEHRIRQVAEACRHFDDGGKRNIDDFLQFLEGYQASDSSAAGTVQLMTVHKAKGITYDVVIVADIEGDGITGTRSLKALSEQDGEGNDEWILLPPKKDVALMVEPLASSYRQAEMDAAFEQLCVLYVALTRARYANFVITSQPSTEDGNCSPRRILQETLVGAEADSEAEVGEEEEDDDEVDVRYEHGDPDWLSKTEPESKKESEPTGPRPIVTAKRKFPPRKRRLPSSAGSDGRPFGDANLWFGQGNARATGFGSAVHALFESLAWIGENSDEELQAKWAEALVGYEDFADDARAEVERSLDNPEIRALFEQPPGSAGEGAEVWMEKRFEMIVGKDQWVSGVFDRVNRFSDRAQIIDFKTNNVSNEEEIAKAVVHYRPQMETYRVALSRLTGLAQDKIECLLVFTKPQRIVSIEREETEGDEPETDEGERTQGELEL